VLYEVDLPQTSRANPVQRYSTHLEKRNTRWEMYTYTHVFMQTIKTHIFVWVREQHLRNKRGEIQTYAHSYKYVCKYAYGEKNVYSREQLLRSRREEMQIYAYIRKHTHKDIYTFVWG